MLTIGGFKNAKDHLDNLEVWVLNRVSNPIEEADLKSTLLALRHSIDSWYALYSDGATITNTLKSRIRFLQGEIQGLLFENELLLKKLDEGSNGAT